MIEIRDLYKSYRSPEGREPLPVLSGLSFSVKDGEFVAIMGESGAGKSTLMNIIGGMDLPDSGSYRLGGVEMTELSPRELTAFRGSRIGFIFQNCSLIPSLTAYENVELVLRYRRMRRSERSDRVTRALNLVGLARRMHHLPGQLSGGQRQKAAVARAIAADPPMILADEPTGSLDAASGKEVMQSLARLHRQGKTVLLITHDARAAAYAERVVWLKDGKLVEKSGTT